MDVSARVRAALATGKKELLAEWMKEQLNAATLRSDLLREAELREQSGVFLDLLQEAIERTSLDQVDVPAWSRVRNMLQELSRSRALAGFSPSETATFVFSLKRPLFALLRRQLQNSEELAEAIWQATVLLDRLGVSTLEMYQKSREEIIARQQRELLELSTPVVELWDGILALPLIGTLDSSRTQVVMESLLNKIIASGAAVAIIDITGVPTVDTLVAQHLLKAVAAARLLGSECILSGIRPQIAATIVHLGVDLGQVTTKARLSDAFQAALRVKRAH